MPAPAHKSNQNRLSRRSLLAAAGMAGATALFLASCGEDAGDQATKQPAGTTDVPIADLMKPGSLSELTLGKPDAKVTIVEYASMTCSHCSRFHNEVFPELKKKYIETGQVYFIMREFPLDNRAAAASMLARCAGDDKTFPLISILFERQKDWAYVKESPKVALFNIAKQVGFNNESFEKCLTDQKLLDGINATRQRAADVFGVSSTPTFFINGNKLKGAQLEDFEKVLTPLLEQKG